MTAFVERRASQDGKRDIPAYPAGVIPRKEVEALDWMRVGIRATIRSPLEIPRWGRALMFMSEAEMDSPTYSITCRPVHTENLPAGHVIFFSG